MVSSKHILAQAPVIRSLGGTALSAAAQGLGLSKPAQRPETPTTPITTKIKPPSAELIRDYVRHVGGDPSRYKKRVPAHLFPHWGFPLAARTLEGLPYPLLKVLNGGCRLEINAPLPQGEALEVSARLESIDDDGRRAVLHQIIETGTSVRADAVVAHLYAIVPLASDKSKKKKDRVRAPVDAEEVGRMRLGPKAGLDFAKLTGDFNPVHWVPAYAKAFGFKNTILHGFSTMARAFELLDRAHITGATSEISVFDVKFVKPLVLPASIGLYVAGDTVSIADAPGGPAYLTGTFETQSRAG